MCQDKYHCNLNWKKKWLGKVLLLYDKKFPLYECHRFHHQRVPLVILVCGTACVGKSTIATQLAQRLNLPNVLQVLLYLYMEQHFLSHVSTLFRLLLIIVLKLIQTAMVYELLRTSTEYVLVFTPFYWLNLVMLKVRFCLRILTDGTLF